MITSTSVLRQHAEAFAADHGWPGAQLHEPMSLEAAQSMVYELHVHQIELEMQNEELRRTQMELDVMRARYVDLYDLAPVGYCTVDATGKITQANLTVAALVGQARAKLAKTLFSKLINSEDQDIFYLFRKQLLKPDDTQTCELRMVKADGSEFWAQLVARVVDFDDGIRVLRIVVSDVSARKRAESTSRLEASLQKSEAFGRAIIDAVPAQIAVIDREGTIVAVNDRWHQSALDHGPQPGPAESKTGVGTNYLSACRTAFKELESESGLIAAQGIQAVLEGQSPRFSMEYPCGTTEAMRWFHMVATPLGPDCQGVVISHTDVTERVLANLALSASEERFALFMNTLLGPETNAPPAGEGIGSGLMAMPEPHLPVQGGQLANLLPAALGAPQRSVNLVSFQPHTELINLVRPNYKRLLGTRVRELRRSCSLTQDALAEHCGIFRTYLSRIELGSANPTLLVLVALASSLNVEPCALLRPAALTLP